MECLRCEVTPSLNYSKDDPSSPQSSSCRCEPVHGLFHLLQIRKANDFLLLSGFLSEKSQVVKIGNCCCARDSIMGLNKVFSDVGIHFLAS